MDAAVLDGLDAVGQPDDSCARGRQRLLDSGKIENAPFGPRSRIRHRLRLAGAYKGSHRLSTGCCSTPQYR